jgi:mono/diheme cytochrome c family protein
VFQRACAGCHLPDGDGGLDLSTADAWDDHRAVIRRQVLVKQAMPPAGSPLSAGDRAALARWLR